MNLDGAARIGVGRTAEVFAWGEGRVLKLFHPWHPEAWSEGEHRHTAAAAAAGLPAPRVYGLERVDGRVGFVLERLEGPSLLQVLTSRPWRALAVARQLAEVHAAVHARGAPGLLPVRERLRWGIDRADLPAALRARATDALARMPDGDAILHGDFHPDNVILTARGPVVLDWSELSTGHPLADVARTSLLLRVASPATGPLGLALKAGRSLLHAAYLRRYLRVTGRTRAELAPFLLPVTAARVGHRIENEQAGLRALLARLNGGA
jgi:aminoglycoside phosphotransferase (APT) family kinase protein